MPPPVAGVRLYEATLKPLSEISAGADGQADPWEELGWKAPVGADGYTPPYDDAFEPQPYAPPDVGPAYGADAPPPFSPDSFSRPFYPPDATLLSYPGPTEPYAPVAAPREAPPAARRKGSEAGAPPPKKNPPAAEPTPESEKPPRGLSAAGRAAKQSWQLVLTIAVALALLFSVVQIAQMVNSLMVSERDRKTERAEYYALAGVDPNSAPSGVELLPAGRPMRPRRPPRRCGRRPPRRASRRTIRSSG
jgi:hypothetical protein